MPDHSADIVIIGAGIVGLATAYAITQQRPDLCVHVVEKEGELAAHQTGRNSGVLHSGIYYKPGSLKAENCRRGLEMMITFCEQESIPYERCGKVIVATREEEVPALERIFERGEANGVICERIGAERLRELEPHVAGIDAIHVPVTGIVDYRVVCERLAERVRQAGGTVTLGAKVVGVRSEGGRVVETTAGAVEARVGVNCAGLYSDKVATLAGVRPGLKIVPFRGEYFELTEEARRFCRTLIYPVPDPAFPFLGVHFTKMVDGGVECGPNAVLAFAREGYKKRIIHPGELAETLTYSGFIRLASRYFATGMGEMWRSFSKAAFVRALQKLVPEIRAEHLLRAPAGVRAQALKPNGELVDDFAVVESEGFVHVLNAPSPAATSSLSIGETVAERVLAQV